MPGLTQLNGSAARALPPPGWPQLDKRGGVEQRDRDRAVRCGSESAKRQRRAVPLCRRRGTREEAAASGGREPKAGVSRRLISNKDAAAGAWVRQRGGNC